VSPVNVSTIGAYIREQREQARISLRQLAQAAGVSNPYLSQIERGLRRPSADILQQIAKGLRISAEALYVQAGFLEDRAPGSALRDAVLTDPDLNERQKQVMIEIYESFRKESVTAAAQEGPPDDADPALQQAALSQAALSQAARAPGAYRQPALHQPAHSWPVLLAGEAAAPGWPWADADAEAAASLPDDDYEAGQPDAPAAGARTGAGDGSAGPAAPAAPVSNPFGTR
jgi:transcriptional regulator with XRE-family HTH domain